MTFGVRARGHFICVTPCFLRRATTRRRRWAQPTGFRLSGCRRCSRGITLHSCTCSSTGKGISGCVLRLPPPPSGVRTRRRGGGRARPPSGRAQRRFRPQTPGNGRRPRSGSASTAGRRPAEGVPVRARLDLPHHRVPVVEDGAEAGRGPGGGAREAPHPPANPPPGARRGGRDPALRRADGARRRALRTLIETPPMYYLCRLIPPRPTFAAEMTADEGQAIPFGPVMDPQGPWGVGIVSVRDALVHE